MTQMALPVVLLMKTVPPPPKLSRPTLVSATTGGVFGAGGATQTAMRPVGSLLILMVQTVSPLLKVFRSNPRRRGGRVDPPPAQ
jgi:hypothetical protein